MFIRSACKNAVNMRGTIFLPPKKNSTNKQLKHTVWSTVVNKQNFINLLEGISKAIKCEAMSISPVSLIIKVNNAISDARFCLKFSIIAN